MEQSTLNVDIDHTILAEYLRTDHTATIGFGPRLSTLCEVRLDYTRGIGKLAPSVGGPDLQYN